MILWCYTLVSILQIRKYFIITFIKFQRQDFETIVKTTESGK